MRKTSAQLQALEKTFASLENPSESTTMRLAKDLGLTNPEVQMWFSSRRFRARRIAEKKWDAAQMRLLKSSRKRCIGRRGGGNDHGLRSRSSDESQSWSPSGSGSDSGSGSASSQSNAPLEAANILGQIASQACCKQSIPQTFTPMEIESRIEKEVTNRVASHVASLRVEMEERMQAMNAKQETMLTEMNTKQGRTCVEMSAKEEVWFNSRRLKDKKQGIVKRSRLESWSHSGSGSSQANEPLDSGDGDGDIKNKMINMLMKENKRDEAKCQSFMDELKRLRKSIEDRKKLIDGIKKMS